MNKIEPNTSECSGMESVLWDEQVKPEYISITEVLSTCSKLVLLGWLAAFVALSGLAVFCIVARVAGK